MLITFENTTELSRGVWLSKTKAKDLRVLKKNGGRRADISVVVLENPEYSVSNGRISANLDSAYLINEGHDDEVLLLEASASSLELSIGATPPNSRDVTFIEYCKGLGMRPEVIELIAVFLNRLRTHGVKDNLEEGKARKWIMRPNNFVTITPQTRNGCFRISVRDTETCLEATNIDWKTGLPSYREFLFSEPRQMEDAVAVALASLHK